MSQRKVYIYGANNYNWVLFRYCYQVFLREERQDEVAPAKVSKVLRLASEWAGKAGNGEIKARKALLKKIFFFIYLNKVRAHSTHHYFADVKPSVKEVCFFKSFQFNQLGYLNYHIQ